LALADPPDRRRLDRRNPSGGKAVFLAFVALFTVAGVLLIWRGRGALPEHRDGASWSKAGVDPDYSLYVGDRVCSECHPGEAAHHSRSGHSRTLRPSFRIRLAGQLDGRSTEDPERPGVVWKYIRNNGQLWTERTDSGIVDRFVLEYAFGSGLHATTFVSLTDRDPRHPVCREHRLTFFAHSQALGLTPGQSLTGHATGNSDRGRVHSPLDTLNCFRCHTTVTSDRGKDVLDESTMIPNVSCERCHGPARSHIEAARRGDDGDTLRLPFGPGRWTTSEQLELCGSCHRLPTTVHQGAIRADNPGLVRHQPVGLMVSACFIKSNRAVSCITCHDPHARASSDRTGYEAVCLSCHGAAQQTTCTVSPRSGCIDCHMPRRDVTRGILMTDHWIRVIPGVQINPLQGLMRESKKVEP
jgi:hypothetical protein